jgi:hypothetical protein
MGANGLVMEVQSVIGDITKLVEGLAAPAGAALA